MTDNPYTRGLAAHREVCAYCTQGMWCRDAQDLEARAAEYAEWEDAARAAEDH